MERVIDRIITGLAVIAGLLLLWVTLSITYTIFARFLGYSGLVSGVQFTEYSLLWMTFLAAAWVLKREKHVSVDLITGLLGPRTRLYFDLFHSVMGVVVCGVLFWYGALVTWGQYKRGIIDIQVVDVPKYLILVIIPIGFLLLALQFSTQFVMGLRKIRNRSGRSLVEDASRC